jgi:dimethylglycine dehydrogenase
VGIIDTSGFSRYEVTGQRAGAWLDRVMAGKLPAPGRARLAPMLGRDGRLKGDLTVFNWGDGTWWIMGSYYLRQWHMRWFDDHREDGVSVRDISDATGGFGLAGPRSRELLASLTHQDVSNAAIPFMGCATVDVGLVRAKVGRMSVCGEMGFEINCGAAEHIGLYRTLKAAGAEFGAVDFGFNAMLSMRIEKSFGIWSKEFTQGYTAGETGMDRWIAWDKGDFTGREAALAERDRGPARKLVTLEVDAPDANAAGYEPVWQGGRRVGFVTSGAYGHCVGKSLAMALVEPGLAAPGTDLSVHVVGVERTARVVAPSPYDPTGTRMRG